MVSLRRQNKMFCLSFVFFLDQIPKIKICHMVVSEHTQVIDRRQRLIVTDVIDSDEVSEDDSIDNNGAASDEEDESGLGEAGVRIGVTQSGIEEKRCSGL